MSLASELKDFIVVSDGWKPWSRGRPGMPEAPRQGAAVWTASLVLNLLGLALPIVILQVYDRILPNDARATMAILVAGLVMVLLLDLLLRSARSAITGWNAARFEHAAACHAVDRLLACNIDRFEKEPAGVHLDRLSAINTLRDYHAGQARVLLLDLPFISLYLGLIYFIASWLVTIPIVIFAVTCGISIWIGVILRRVLGDRAILDDRRYSFVIEVLSGIQSIKLLAMEPQMQRRYERLQEAGAASSYSVTVISNLAQGTGWFFSNLMMVSVATGGAVAVMEGSLSIGGLAASTLLAGRAVQPVLRALGLWAQYQTITIAEDRLEQVFSLQPESPEKPLTAALDSPEIAGGIRLENVSFAYDAGAPELIRELSLEVSPGEVIGVSGDSGSGKTTFLMMIMGLLKPTQGSVTIDGLAVDEADPYALRPQIALLPQTGVLFQGSILENLTLFQGATELDNALAAARLIGVDPAIRRLPDGYQTQVGKGASMELPIGLKQGIAMARTLARNPKIVLFDEANGGLDSAADKRLKDALASLKGKATIIMVSHRPSLLDLADRRFDLVEGRLVPRVSKTPSEEVQTSVVQTSSGKESTA